MKSSSLFLAIVAPTMTVALVGNTWSFSGNPPGGLKDVTFGFNIAGAPHAFGYYFAQQFNFENVEQVGYCGIQNRENQDGNNIVHAVFSSFQSGTTSDDTNCHDGADGGAGVSCAVEFEGDYASTWYDVLVENIRDTTWSARVINRASGDSVHIGTWTLPEGAGGIVNNQVGFVEYYPWNSGTHQCAQLPKVEVVFYSPSSTTPGAGAGEMGRPYEYGDCVGQVDFSTSVVDYGYDISVGFGSE